MECLGLEAKTETEAKVAKGCVWHHHSPVESVVQFSVSKDKISSTRALEVSLGPRSQADLGKRICQGGRDQSTDSGSRQTSQALGQLFTQGIPVTTSLHFSAPAA